LEGIVPSIPSGDIPSNQENRTAAHTHTPRRHARRVTEPNLSGARLAAGFDSRAAWDDEHTHPQ